MTKRYILESVVLRGSQAYAITKEVATIEKSNMRKLANGHYLVRSQAGFRRAIKEFFDEHELRHASEIEGHPTAYPAIVAFSYLYGWNKPQARCWHVNAYRQGMRDILADLEGE